MPLYHMLQNNIEQEDLAKRLIKKAKFGGGTGEAGVGGKTVDSGVVEGKKDSVVVQRQDKDNGEKEKVDGDEEVVASDGQGEGEESETAEETAPVEEETATEEVPTEEASTEETQVEETATEEATAEETATEEVPAEEASTEEASTEEAPAEETASEEAPVQETTPTANETTPTANETTPSANETTPSANETTPTETVQPNQPTSNQTTPTSTTEVTQPTQQPKTTNQDHKLLIPPLLIGKQFNIMIPAETSKEKAYLNPRKLSLSDKHQTDIKHNNKGQEKTEYELVKEKAASAAKTGAQIIFLLFIILLIALYMITFFFSFGVFYFEITRAVANGYTEFIEKQGQTKELTEKRIKQLNSLKWREVDTELHDIDDLIEEFEDFYGQVHIFDLREKVPHNFVLSVTDPVETKKREKEAAKQKTSVNEKWDIDYAYHYNDSDAPYMYFELSVEYLHDNTNLIIGYTDKKNLKEMKPDEFPGKGSKSIGFNIKTGEVYFNGAVTYTFNFLRIIKNEFGDDYNNEKFDFNGSFFGVGMNLKSKLVFFTFNGKILNSLSYQTTSEIRYKIYRMKKADALEEGDNSNIKKVGKLSKLVNKLDIEKEYRNDLKTLPNFSISSKELVPIISVDGACKFLVNIGGSMFQTKEKIIQLGLLRKKT